MRKLKSLIASWIYGMAVRVHPRYGVCIINRTLPWGRPTLDYLEFHLADHCNLNCAGCLHYAPFADKRLADVEVVRRDFARMRELFANVRHVRIMGGEPLLHPQAVEFARIVREAFPRSKVCVVTNGLLLASFRGLAELARLKVGVDWTKYPPLAGKEAQIRTLCAQAGVSLRVTENSAFMARLVPDGAVGIRKSFRWCRKRLYCPLLDNGRVYTCAPARFAPYYNKAAGTRLFAEPGLDIHKSTAREIMTYLMSPSFACRFCADSARTFAWKASCKPEDWCR